MSFNYYGSAEHVVTYCKFRPSPPRELIEMLVNFLKEGGGREDVAVDVGCGSGQSTVVLAPYFANAIGLEPCASAVEQANKTNKVRNVLYKISSAEVLAMESQSADLVMAVQAAHWFDKPKFYAEADRVLKKRGVLALVGYHLPEIVSRSNSSQISSIIKKYYTEVLKDYVSRESRQVYLDNYRDPVYSDVPFIEEKQMIREEDFATEMQATIQELSGYVSSWSGFQNYVKKASEEAGKELIHRFEDECVAALGTEANSPITVQYRYFVLLGRKGN